MALNPDDFRLTPASIMFASPCSSRRWWNDNQNEGTEFSSLRERIDRRPLLRLQESPHPHVERAAKVIDSLGAKYGVDPRTGRLKR
jgi:hypothetical protein